MELGEKGVARRSSWTGVNRVDSNKMCMKFPNNKNMFLKKYYIKIFVKGKGYDRDEDITLGAQAHNCQMTNYSLN